MFRVDASIELGAGHVVRCSILAEALREAGAEVQFICRILSGDRTQWLEARGFKVHRLDATGFPSELEALAAQGVLNADAPIDWLIVDHYALDCTWESTARQFARQILVIDDLANRRHDCDALLDQNLVSDAGGRYEGKLPSTCRQMLGPAYALLHKSYREWRLRARPRQESVGRLLVSFGGVDEHNLTMRTLAALRDLKRRELQIDVVTGAGYPYEDELRDFAASMAHVTLHKSLTSLAPLMAEADAAIGAGGTTTWERCCLGLPSLIITIADNQIPIAKELDHRGLARWVGHFDVVSQLAITEAVSRFLCERHISGEIESCRELVDGMGVDRVVAVLTASSTMPLDLRDARLDDEKLLLRWANDPEVRANSFSSLPIDPEVHSQWFRTRIGRDPRQVRIYIAMTKSGVPVGQVRFERRIEEWHIGYSIDPLFRGRGLAGKILAQGLECLRGDIGPCLVVGRVKADNLASRRTFESLGFLAENEADGYRYCLSVD